MVLHDLLIAFMALMTGLLLGMLGSGGSILALPAFLYAAGLPVKPAVATSLAVVGAISLLGAIRAQAVCHKRGCPGQEIDVRITLLMIAGGLVGAYAGAHLAFLISSRAQLLLFAAVMLIAAVGMFRRKAMDPSADPQAALAQGEAHPKLVLPLGLGVGLLNGLVGVGGGFLIVPALALPAKVPVKRAAAMSLWVIAANSAAGMLGYLGRVPVAWEEAGVFLVIAMIGMAFGQAVAVRAHPQWLQKTFAVFLVLVGVFTVLKTETTHHVKKAPVTHAQTAPPQT